MEKTEKLSFEIQLNVKELFAFNIYQTYTGVHGWVSIIVGGMMLVLGILMMTGYSGLAASGPMNGLMYMAIGLVIIFYVPISLWSRVRATMKKNESLANPLTYCVDEEKIAVTQGEASAELLWEQVYKMTGNKKRVLIFSNRVNAYVIPVDQLGEENLKKLKAIAGKVLPAYRNKLKAD